MLSLDLDLDIWAFCYDSARSLVDLERDDEANYARRTDGRAASVLQSLGRLHYLLDAGYGMSGFTVDPHI